MLDASVAVAAARPQEPRYAAAFERVSRVLAALDEIVVPALFRVEVGAALGRTGFETKWIDSHVDHLLASATVVVVGPLRSKRVQRVAMSAKLRAADATYVWLAGREGIPLVTLDEEVLVRGAAFCSVERP